MAAGNKTNKVVEAVEEVYIMYTYIYIYMYICIDRYMYR